MDWQYSIFIGLAPIAGLISLCLIVMIWSKRTTIQTSWLLWLLVLILGWLVTNTLELLAISEVATLFWAKTSYLFIVLIPVGWFGFALQYTNNARYLAPKYFIFFLIVPVTTVVLAWTNALHPLLWQAFQYTPGEYYNALSVTHGPWFWIHAVFSYSVVMAGSALIVKEFFYAPQIYRHQSLWLLIGSSIPLIVNLIYLAKLIPGLNKDYSPISFALAGAALAVGILRFGFMDLKPIAHGALIKCMKEGMLVLDEFDRIVDYNPAFQEIIGRPVDDVVGRPAQQVFYRWPDLLAYLEEPTELQVQIKGPGNRKPCYYSLSASCLSQQSAASGRLFLFRDISSYKLAEETLRASEIRYRALFERTNDAVFIIDLDLVIQTANQHAATLLGYEMDELAGMHIYRIVHKDEWQDAIDKIEMVKSGHLPDIYQRRFIRRDGSPVPVEISLALVHDPDGQPLHIQSIVRDITERKQTENQLKMLASMDALTEVYNRRYFFDLARQEFKRSKRFHHDFSLILMDIDHFKQINDRYGHLVGDQVLYEFAKRCKRTVRAIDMIGRWGGEEFVILLAETSLSDAYHAAERLRGEIESIPIPTTVGQISLTISVGVTSMTTELDLTVEELLVRADKALYRSKDLGRNRVTCWQDGLVFSTTMRVPSV